MKKKIVSIVFIIAIAVTCLLNLIACNNNTDLAYEKKYIGYIYSRPEKQSYYIFHKNGECEYHYTYEKEDYKEYWIDDEGGHYLTQKEGTAKVDYTVKYNYTCSNDNKWSTIYLSEGVVIDNSTYTDTDGNVTPLQDTEWYQNNYDRFIRELYTTKQITVSASVVSSKNEIGLAFYYNEDFVDSLHDMEKIKTS